MTRGQRTGADGDTEDLLEEAVDETHVPERGVAPAVHSDDTFDLLPKGCRVLGVRCKIV